MEEEQNSETSPPTPSFNVYPGCGGTGWTRPIDANFENWWSGGNSDECEQCHKCSEEHKCDASLTKQLLPRLDMLHSMLCSSAVQHLIIRIHSLISTCYVAVWHNCTEGNAIGIVDAESANNPAIYRAKSRTIVSMRALQCSL